MLKKIIKVLLIENKRLDACIVQEMLAQEKNIKFKFKFVNCLSEGLKRLAKGGIDVVLLDFTLQKNKGISALSKIHTQAPQVAIVVQTILADKSTAVKALQKGAQDYLINDSLNSDLLVRSLSYSVEKKNIENMLRESEEKFKKFEESANKPIILIGLKGNLLSLNNCAASNFGGKPKDYISKTLWDIFPKKVADERFKDHQKVIQSGRSNVKEITVSFKGKEYYYLARIQPIRNKSGDINSVLILDKDITDRKKTEKYLAESEERYRILFENTGTATIISEEDRTISMVNTQGEKLSGYSKEEIENKMKWTDFIIPEDLKRMKKYHITRKKAGEKPPTEYEFRMTDKKGNVKDIFLKIGMIPDTKKSIASFIDIAELKRAEEKLLESKEQLTQIVYGNSIATFVIDNEHRITHWNKACEKLTGLSAKEMYGTNKQWKAFYAKERPMISDVILDKLPDKKIKKYYYKTYRKSSLIKGAHEAEDFFSDIGEKGKWLFFTAAPIEDHNGNIISAIETLQDITEQKKAEEELKDSEERLKILFDYAPDAYYISDLKGNFIDGNKAAERVIGYKREELIGKSFLKLKLLSLADISKAAKALAKNIIGKPTGPNEFVLNRKDNSKVTVEISTYPVKIKEKTLVLGIARDITERKQAEEEIKEKSIELEKQLKKSEEQRIATLSVLSDLNDTTEELHLEINERKQAEERLKKTMDATIDAMSKIIEAKDPYTAGHQHRVCQLAVPLARELGLSEDKIEGIRIASLIHDIGKIGLPTEILSKPTTLTDIEFNIIKEHSQIGYDILKSIDFPYPVAQIVLQHHDRLDGSGYPSNLKGDKILLEAKIIGVADVVEAMSSHRPYRPALGIEKALEEISQNKGILYDSEVVDTCIRLFKEKGFKFE